MTASINASTSSGVVVTSDTSGVLALQTAGTTAVTINSSQYVGIGTSSPSAPLDVNKSGGGDVGYFRASGGTNNPFVYINSNESSNLVSIGSNASVTYPALAFQTSGSERMRIDSSGNLLVGTTSSLGSKLSVNSEISLGTDSNNRSIFTFSSGGTVFGTINGGTTYFNSMTLKDGNLLVGVTTPDTTISSQTKQTVLNGIAIKGGTYDVAMLQNGVYGNWDAYRVYNASNVGVYLNNGSTSWTATSDSRLKTITGTYTNALADVAQIQAVKFTWKADQQNTPQVGVLAQSVQAVVPEAISQSKIIEGDETEYFGVRYTELIPLLIASVQELNTLVTQQATDITALKAKVGV